MADDTVRRIADELEIRNLVARLAHAADRGDLERDYLPLLTDDVLWEFPGGADPGAEAATIKGHEAVLADRNRRRASGFQGPGTNTRHLNTTLAVRVDGSDTAEAESYWLFVSDTGTSDAKVRSLGHYYDTFRRTSDGWRLASRRITPG
jgi:hypothetical protein